MVKNNRADSIDIVVSDSTSSLSTIYLSKRTISYSSRALIASFVSSRISCPPSSKVSATRGVKFKSIRR